ncbi:hypothetical protein EDD71_109107 [Fonticella tunisiensis]|uniref:Uncharacterized protein n=1 Tax=Fonticella tunisiensis TaxID=1096341 RepID=A0A4R7KSL7_9CLOT|nr:hypothetical protein EDD71_109107 [Fonticella tunisiensis]
MTDAKKAANSSCFFHIKNLNKLVVNIFFIAASVCKFI